MKFGEWAGSALRRPGRTAFWLHRLTGIALAVYLLLHLAVLSQLRGGPERWGDFLVLARSPFFLGLDLLLLEAALFHGLNGVRLVFLGFGRGLRWQEQSFWFCVVSSLGLCALAGIGMLR
jgi:succinate dehydrogenase / fumarate reductase cytochrome b subunit